MKFNIRFSLVNDVYAISEREIEAVNSKEAIDKLTVSLRSEKLGKPYILQIDVVNGGGI